VPEKNEEWESKQTSGRKLQFGGKRSLKMIPYRLRGSARFGRQFALLCDLTLDGKGMSVGEAKIIAHGKISGIKQMKQWTAVAKDEV
jgi:hypothetical protein